MGVPSRSYETGGVKYLAYNEHRIDIVPAFPSYSPFFTGWYGGGFPPQVDRTAMRDDVRGGRGHREGVHPARQRLRVKFMSVQACVSRAANRLTQPSQASSTQANR